MAQIICPNCYKMYVVSDHSYDFVCDCNDFPINPVIAQQDVPVTGDWVDYDGSGTAHQPLVADQANKLAGTRAGFMGMKLTDKTARGENAAITRQRGVLTDVKVD